MSLQPGQRIATYEIVGPLGAGGMGEVYRARDSKLGREVAIKVLPDSFARDAERLARFEREARLLASLNHPNIAAIYGLEEADGLRALVMELVEGPTLAERLQPGAIPLEESLQIAKQIAEALEEAHDKGIIHRDLKPANVKLTPEGKVKVLDFGLAKAMEGREESAASASLSPTLTSLGTAAGMILGTAAYMSPEQARGRAADRRADIWSFGAVLYQMLTGRQPFAGETVSDTLAAVLARDPEWAPLEARVPARVQKIIRRCLQKDPRRRYQAIGDARIEIEEALLAPEEPSTAAVIPVRPRSRWAGAAIVAAGMVLAAAATYLATPRSAPPSPPVLRKFEIQLDAVLPRGGNQRPLMLSPDGTRVTYEHDGSLWVRDFTQLTVRKLAGSAGGKLPFWSPDGQSVAFVAGDRLWRVPLNADQPAAVCSLSGQMQGGVWGKDGRILFALIRGPLFEVPALGGEPKALLTPDGVRDIDFHQPSFLPGDEAFIYAVHRKEGVDTIEAFSHGERKVLLRLEGQARNNVQVVNLPVYSPTGHLLYQRDAGNRGIWAVRFSPERLATDGEPFLIAAGGEYPSIAADGTLLFALQAATGPRELVWIDRAGKAERASGTPRLGFSQVALSPDETRAAVVIDENGNKDIWIYDLRTGTNRRLTLTPDDETFPSWLPGGDRVAFDCGSAEGVGICVKAADGSGETQRLAALASNATFSPDGRYLAYEPSGEARRGIMLLDRKAGGEARHFLNVSYDVAAMSFSPDGRFLAYFALEAGKGAVYVSSVPGGESKWMVTPADGWDLEWSRNGKEIYLSADSEGIDVVPVETSPTFQAGTIRRLFATGPLGAAAPSDEFDVAGDGRVLMFQESGRERRRSSFHIVQNWAVEFEK